MNLQSYKTTYQHLINAGVYVINPKMLKHITSGELLDMPNYINNLQSIGSRIAICPIHEYWIDIGMHECLEQARNKPWS